MHTRALAKTACRAWVQRRGTAELVQGARRSGVRVLVGIAGSAETFGGWPGATRPRRFGNKPVLDGRRDEKAMRLDAYV